MDMDVIKSLSDLSHISNSNEFFSWIKTRTLPLGFNHFLFRLRTTVNADTRSGLIIGDFPVSWREAYTTANYDKIDPVVLHCMHSVLPLIWSDRIYASSNQRSLREEAATHGLINGVTLPLHGPQGQFGTFDLSINGVSEQDAKGIIQAAWGELLLLKNAGLQSALSFLSTPKNTTSIKLTKREKEVLQWSAIGKTSWEISSICNCSESNVDFHFKNIRRKFGVTSRSAAAVQALSMQIIHV